MASILSRSFLVLLLVVILEKNPAILRKKILLVNVDYRTLVWVESQRIAEKNS